MTRPARFLLAASILLACAAPAAADDAPQGARTLLGEFVWTDTGISGDLEAVFTPAGDDLWDVAFHFEFRGEPHVYSGTARGNLADGELSGEVQNETKQRTFTFGGKFDGATYKGTHAETTPGRARDTGTLTLAAEGVKSLP